FFLVLCVLRVPPAQAGGGFCAALVVAAGAGARAGRAAGPPAGPRAGAPDGRLPPPPPPRPAPPRGRARARPAPPLDAPHPPALPSILDSIVAHKRREVAARREAGGAPSLADAPPPRDFAAALRGERVRLIAEVKKASPSRGVLRPNFDPLALADDYAANGAAA